MERTSSALALRGLMMCCWIRNWATSTTLLNDRFRIFSAQLQIRAQEAFITSLLYDWTRSVSSELSVIFRSRLGRGGMLTILFLRRPL